MEKVKCTLCGGETKLFSTKNNYNIYKCFVCKLLFVNPIPKSLSVYDETYFAGAGKGFGYVDYDSDKEPMRPVFLKYLKIISKLGLSKGKLLDVGSATGYFMNIAKDAGFTVSGVEISDYAANIGRRKGLDIKTGVLEDLSYPDNTFDIITMFDVLEHVSSPVDFIEKAKKLLKSGGLLVINTPDCESWWAKILGSKWHLILPPEHLFYFSPVTLRHYLSNDFDVLYDGKIGKSFTFQYIFKMLYKWQKIKLWDSISRMFSKGLFSKFSIPINLHDNLFMVFKKK